MCLCFSPLQTESTAASTLTMPGDDCSFGNVGTPLVCNLVKLVDVPEMNYTASDIINGAPCPRGEVCFKGTNICQSTTEFQFDFDTVFLDETCLQHQ